MTKIEYQVSSIKYQGKIKSFIDLVAWQEAHELVLFIYQETKNFLKEEMFGIVSQMRRCAVSVTSNIAEGFSRRSKKEKCQFYAVSQSSLTELQSQLLIAKDISFLEKNKFGQIAEKSVKVHKLISGLIKSADSILNT